MITLLLVMVAILLFVAFWRVFTVAIIVAVVVLGLAWVILVAVNNPAAFRPHQIGEHG